MTAELVDTFMQLVKKIMNLITYLIYKKDKIAKVPNQILNMEYITQLVAQLTMCIASTLTENTQKVFHGI